MSEGEQPLEDEVKGNPKQDKAEEERPVEKKPNLLDFLDNLDEKFKQLTQEEATKVAVEAILKFYKLKDGDTARDFMSAITFFGGMANGILRALAVNHHMDEIDAYNHVVKALNNRPEFATGKYVSPKKSDSS